MNAEISPPSDEPPARRANPRGRAWRVADLVARVILGGLFVYMGVSKGLDPVGFLKLIREYDMVRSSWALTFISATLPWFEAFCGLLFLAGIAVRGTALVSCAMLVPFTALVWKRALALQAASQIPFCAVRFDCGCGAGEVLICYKLLENGLLVLLCLGLLKVRTHRDPTVNPPARTFAGPAATGA